MPPIVLIYTKSHFSHACFNIITMSDILPLILLKYFRYITASNFKTCKEVMYEDSERSYLHQMLSIWSSHPWCLSLHITKPHPISLPSCRLICNYSSLTNIIQKSCHSPTSPLQLHLDSCMELDINTIMWCPFSFPGISFCIKCQMLCHCALPQIGATITKAHKRNWSTINKSHDNFLYTTHISMDFTEVW